MKRNLMNRLAFLPILAVVLCQNEVYAAEGVTVPTEDKEVVSVVLPVVEERDPFSFFIDPLHIFYNTFGDSSGDITVEEDTYLLFYNRDESEYTLSSRSDRLKIINKSTVNVELTITAKLENIDGIFVIQEDWFEERESCDLYLALVDNEGNEQPLSEDGEVSVTVNLDRAPLDAYAYVLDEDAGEYGYICQTEDVAFDTYSFGLTGACNEKGDWTGISGTPHVTVSWSVEPVIPDDSDVADGDEKPVEGDKELVRGDEDPAGKAEIDTKPQVSEGNGSDGGVTTEEYSPDSEDNGAVKEEAPGNKEEEPGNDSSADESVAAEESKDESGVPEEEQPQESDKPDEPTEDSDAAKEESPDNKAEESDNDSFADESAGAEDLKDESGAPEEEQAKELNKPDEPVEDMDASATTMD